MTPTTLCAVIMIASQSFASLPTERAELACNQAETIIEEAERYDFDPLLLFSLIWVESRWVPDAVSSAGACGLTQVLPRYVDETCSDLKNPETSIRVGAASLNKWTTMRVRRNGRLVRVPRTGGIRTALACYNAGYACADSSRGLRYADRILRITARANAEMERLTPAQQAEEGVNEPRYYSPMDLAYSPVLISSGNRSVYQPVLVLERFGE